MSGKGGGKDAVPSPVRVYVDRIGKIIPTELTGAYVAVQAYLGIPEQPKDNIPILFAVASFFTLLVPFYLVYLRGVPWRGSSNWSNRVRIIVSTISLPIWAVNISINYFVVWLSGHGYDVDTSPTLTKIPVIVLICWALVTPLFLGRERK